MDGDLHHLGLEQVASAGDHPDHLALVVAERGADFADALKQAVLADMDVRPGGFHQLLLAQDAAGIAGEQPQYLQRLGPQLDDLAIGPAQIGALGIELEIRKSPAPSPSRRQPSASSPRTALENVLKPTSAANIRKISECLDGNLRTSRAQTDMDGRVDLAAERELRYRAQPLRANSPTSIPDDAPATTLSRHVWRISQSDRYLHAKVS